MRALDFTARVLASLLPKRYRSWYATENQLRAPALVSGLAQYFACLAILLARYVHGLERTLDAMGHAVVAGGREDVLAAPAVQYGMGFLALINFLVHPLSLLLFYLTLEGLVRFAAAAVTREVLATLPLCLFGRGSEVLEAAFARGWLALRAAQRRPHGSL